MKYISIGRICNVKHQIDKHKHKNDNETLFFDWLLTSMNSVIEILSCKDINNILYFDNIQRYINKPYYGDNSCIVIKSLDLCVSIHDLLRDYSDNDILDFINKYKRRFERIIKYIKSDEKIYFIRNDRVDDNTIDKFIETILDINPNCNFAIVIIDNDKENNSEFFKYEHCLYIKLNIPPESDWTTSYLNWEKIFSFIENNI
jgi:hypothetical protein